MSELDSKQFDESLAKVSGEEHVGVFLLDRESPRLLGLQSIRLKGMTKWLNMFSVGLLVVAALSWAHKTHHNWSVTTYGGEVIKIQPKTRS